MDPCALQEQVLGYIHIIINKKSPTFCANGRAIHGEKNGPRIRTIAIGTTMNSENMPFGPEANAKPDTKYAQTTAKLTHPHTKPNKNIMTVYPVHPECVMLTAMRGLGWIDA
jgi:hypothetical protein